jgi:plastocyanin
MKHLLFAIALITTTTTVTSWASAQQASATQPAQSAQPVSPSTQPARGVIAGRVTIATGWGAAKPDLSRAVVYLASDPLLDAEPVETPAAPAAPAVIAQRDKAFVPNFLLVPRGTEVEFPNWDRFDHNVFSRSAAAPAFDLDRYRYGKSKTRRFDKLGVVSGFWKWAGKKAEVGFEPTNNGFAIRPLSPLGYSAAGDIVAGTISVAGAAIKFAPNDGAEDGLYKLLFRARGALNHALLRRRVVRVAVAVARARP